MPHEQMNDKQVASYLHMDLREVSRLASRGKLPCHRHRGSLVFRKSEIDHWVERQIHTLDRRRLAGIEKGVSAHHGLDARAPLVGPMIPPDGLGVPLEGRTKDSVIRALADLACECGLVCDSGKLVEEVRNREKLCSTAIAPQVALPHPRHPMPHDISASFVVAGVTSGGIPFGSTDGSLTRLFFLVCCKDDRTHLHVLARLGQMLQDRAAVDEMIAAQNGGDLRSILNRWELAVLAQA